MAGVEVSHQCIATDLGNCAYVMKPPEQPEGQGLESYQSGGTLGDVGRAEHLESAWKLSTPPSCLALCISSM